MKEYDKHACDFKNESECEEELESSMKSYEQELEKRFGE